MVILCRVGDETVQLTPEQVADISSTHGNPITEVPIPLGATRVDFRHNKRKAYAYGWYFRRKGMLDLGIVAAYSCGPDRDLVNHQIPVPGGSFPLPGTTVLGGYMSKFEAVPGGASWEDHGRTVTLTDQEILELAKVTGLARRLVTTTVDEMFDRFPSLRDLAKPEI